MLSKPATERLKAGKLAAEKAILEKTAVEKNGIVFELSEREQKLQKTLGNEESDDV